jgi:hypothetical protein
VPSPFEDQVDQEHQRLARCEFDGRSAMCNLSGPSTAILRRPMERSLERCCHAPELRCDRSRR